MKRQYSRLKYLNFKTLRCKFRGEENEVSLSRENLEAFFDLPESSEIRKSADRYGVKATELLQYIEDGAFTRQKDRYSVDDDIVTAIVRFHGYRWDEAVKHLAKIRESHVDSIPDLSPIDKTLQRVSAEFEIVYLPTYRCIELPVSEGNSEPGGSRRKRPAIPGVEAGLLTGNIQFGLDDIAERLSQLNQRILFESNSKYREISANIINELIDGTFQNSKESGDALPRKEELELFFARLADGRRQVAYGPIAIPNIDKIYSGELQNNQSRQFLDYFLGKLNTAIQATKNIEAQVEEFIKACNKYLELEDRSAQLQGPTPTSLSAYSDAKKLLLNRKNLKVSVESLALEQEISLNSLSSGEKQILFIFAKLFLYEKPKIFLIDEPELSLSIDWQKQILCDVVNARQCKQIIAITHSPFVFSNELDPYAKSLDIKLEKRH